MSTITYAKNRALADKFEVQIRRILGEVFFINDFTKDVQENTDLVVLQSHRMNVACRIRNYQYWKRYANEITIRCKSEYNNETELDKLINGFGDFMFYGFIDEAQEKIIAYRLIDLDILRGLFIRKNHIISDAIPKQGKYGRKVRFNRRDNTAFIPVNLFDIQEAIYRTQEP